MRAQSAICAAVTTITTTITVAAGVFAPGHLGELTWQVPFELADAVLEETRAAERRLRVLPSRVGIYFVLALGLFPALGYGGVWAKLTAALDGLPLSFPSAKGLRDLRRRLGPAPFRALFEVLAGPSAQPATPGIRFGRYRTVAFDGCTSIKVPDTARNRSWLGKMNAALGVTGYPAVELMTLVETGTRALLGAVFGPPATDETDYARQLLHLLGPDMLVLADRGFDAAAFLAEIAASGAAFLVRLTATRRPPVMAQLDDGSFLSKIGDLAVRVIAADITVTCADGTRYTGRYRLATTLADHRRFPPRRWSACIARAPSQRQGRLAGGGGWRVRHQDWVGGQDPLMQVAKLLAGLDAQLGHQRVRRRSRRTAAALAAACLAAAASAASPPAAQAAPAARPHAVGARPVLSLIVCPARHHCAEVRQPGALRPGCVCGRRARAAADKRRPPQLHQPGDGNADHPSARWPDAAQAPACLGERQLERAHEVPAPDPADLDGQARVVAVRSVLPGRRERAEDRPGQSAEPALPAGRLRIPRPVPARRSLGNPARLGGGSALFLCLYQPEARDLSRDRADYPSLPEDVPCRGGSGGGKGHRQGGERNGRRPVHPRARGERAAAAAAETAPGSAAEAPAARRASGPDPAARVGHLCSAPARQQGTSGHGPAHLQRDRLDQRQRAARRRGIPPRQLTGHARLPVLLAKRPRHGRVRAGTMGFGKKGTGVWHFHQFAKYRLLKANKKLELNSGKVGFCIAPTDPIDILLRHSVWNPQNLGFGRGECGSPSALWVQEELPVGWGDTYAQYGVGQAFTINNVPNGTYYIETIANPEHVLRETNTANDVTRRKIILGGTPGHRTVKVPPWHGIDPEP